MNPPSSFSFNFNEIDFSAFLAFSEKDEKTYHKI
jgi:hypothetical protein